MSRRPCNLFEAARERLISPLPNISLGTSARALVPGSAIDLLGQVLELATTRPVYNLDIRGTHQLGMVCTTDFDFSYEITDHLVREATYVALPPQYQETRLDVSQIEAYINGGGQFKPREDLPLVDWAKSHAPVSGGPRGVTSSGISYTHRLETAPDGDHIATLARRVAYGGSVSCSVHSEKPESELISFNRSYPLDTCSCLHIRSVWRFVCAPNATLTDWQIVDTGNAFPRGELDVQQAMVGRKTDWLTDNDIALIVNLPLRILVEFGGQRGRGEGRWEGGHGEG